MLNQMLKLRHYKKATKLEKISHLFWQNSCFYSVASKQVGDFFKFLWPSQKSWSLQKYRNRLREHFPDVSNHEIRHLSFSIQWFTFSIENWQWSKKTVPKLASAFFCICFPIELYILKIEEQYKKSNYGFPRTGQHILWFMGWNIQCHVSFGQCCPRDRI